MKKIILLILLVSTNWIYSQTWNNINFISSDPSAVFSYVEHSIKDNSNNIYIKAFHNYNNLNTNKNRIEKFDSNDNLIWSKQIVLSSIINNGNTYRKLQLNGSDIYMNDFTTSSKGIIIKTPNTNVATYSAWETLGGTSTSRIYDIKIKGNELYALGTYQSNVSSSNTIIFNSTASSSLSVPGNKTYTFIAKYSISPKQLIWVKKIESGSSVNGKSLEIDNANNIYVSGNFSNSITLFNGLTPYTFSPSGSFTFLTKFDSNGNYNTSFGLKQVSGTYNNTFSIKVDDLNNNVIYSHDDNISSYTSNGLINWTRSVPNTGAIYDIETNNCGDVYATGDSFSPVSKAPDHQNFFGILLNKNSGNTMWVSNALNNVNGGSTIFVNSDNSAKFIGNFNGNGINIDSFNSSLSKGFFFAKLNSQNTNSCCNFNVNLGNDIVLCQGQTVPSINIFGQGFDNPNFTINWFLNGHHQQTGGQQLMTSVISGTVSVQITYPGCETIFTDSISIITIKPIVIELQSTYYNCGNTELELCGPTPPQGITYNYNWGSISTGLSLSPNQCFVPTQPGDYSLTVTDSNGCFTTTHNFSVLNQLPPLDLGPDINACVGDHISPISFANQGYDNGNYTITWSHNGNIVQNGGTTLQYMPNSGTITLTVSSPGCPSQIHTINVSIRVCCPEEVNIGIIMCPGQAPIFHILNQGYDLPGYNITWYFNGNVIQNGGEILQMSLYGNGILSVTVEKDGCKNIVSDQISISCDKDVHPHHGKEIEKELKESTTNNNLNIYPNPTSDIVNFVFDNSETGKIEIYSLEGKLVFSKEFKEINQIEASLSNYQDGVYIARISTGDNTVTKKIVKK